MRIIDYRSTTVPVPVGVQYSLRNHYNDDSSAASFYGDNDGTEVNLCTTPHSLCTPTCSSTHTESSSSQSPSSSVHSRDSAILQDIAKAANLPRVPELFLQSKNADASDSARRRHESALGSHNDQEPDDLDFSCWELEEEEEDGIHDGSDVCNTQSTPTTTIAVATSPSDSTTKHGMPECPTTSGSSETNKKKKKSRSAKKSPDSSQRKKKSKSMSSASPHVCSANRKDMLPSISIHKSRSSHCTRRYEQPESPAEELIIDMQKTVDGLIRRVRARIKRAVTKGQKSLQISLARFMNGSRWSSILVSMRKYDAYRRRAMHWAAAKERLEDVFLTLEGEMRRARFDGRMDMPFTMDPNVALKFTSELQSLHAIIEKATSPNGTGGDDEEDESSSHHQNGKTDKELVQELQNLSKALPEEDPSECLSPRKSRHLRASLHREQEAPLSPSKTRRGGKRPDSTHGVEVPLDLGEAL